MIISLLKRLELIPGALISATNDKLAVAIFLVPHLKCAGEHHEYYTF
jgi:hypothetical protein